jgi:hypothetical protein
MDTDFSLLTQLDPLSQDLDSLSPSSTKRALLTFLVAVLSCKALDIQVPILQHELKEKAYKRCVMQV